MTVAVNAGLCPELWEKIADGLKGSPAALSALSATSLSMQSVVHSVVDRCEADVHLAMDGCCEHAGSSKTRLCVNMDDGERGCSSSYRVPSSAAAEVFGDCVQLLWPSIRSLRLTNATAHALSSLSGRDLTRCRHLVISGSLPIGNAFNDLIVSLPSLECLTLLDIDADCDFSPFWPLLKGCRAPRLEILNAASFAHSSPRCFRLPSTLRELFVVTGDGVTREADGLGRIIHSVQWHSIEISVSNPHDPVLVRACRSLQYVPCSTFTYRCRGFGLSNCWAVVEKARDMDTLCWDGVADCACHVVVSKLLSLPSPRSVCVTGMAECVDGHGFRATGARLLQEDVRVEDWEKGEGVVDAMRVVSPQGTTVIYERRLRDKEHAHQK